MILGPLSTLPTKRAAHIGAFDYWPRPCRSADLVGKHVLILMARIAQTSLWAPKSGIAVFRGFFVAKSYCTTGLIGDTFTLCIDRRRESGSTGYGSCGLEA